MFFFSLSFSEFIPVFNLWDRVVGLNRWAFQNWILKSSPSLSPIPSVGTGMDINAEAILAVHPDLVITWSYRPEVGDFLCGHGLRVLSVYPESLEELYAMIELAGRIFQQEERAAVRSNMENLFDLIRSHVDAVPTEKRRKVLWLWQKPTRVSGAKGLQQDLGKLIGANSPTGGTAISDEELSLEQIIAWNPDVIFIWGYAGYGPEDLLQNPQWQPVKAIRDGRVYKAPVAASWSPSVCLMTLWMA